MIVSNQTTIITQTSENKWTLEDHVTKSVQYTKGYTTAFTESISIYFKLIYLRSIAKQVIPTYINCSRPLISDGIHLIFKRGLRGKRSQALPYILSAKQGSIWYHFYNVFGMTRSGIEPTTSRLRGERYNHWVTAVVMFTLLMYS